VEGRSTIATYRAWLPDTPPPHDVSVEKGYCHGWQQGGKSVQYAYDQETGRAYYAATSQRRLKRDPEP
jgi:hypothetical protein